VHKPDVPTQENHLPAQRLWVQTLARLLVALQWVALQWVGVQKVEAQKTDQVEPLDPLEGQLGFQEERIRD
jgi:hypothetical protein